MTDISPAPEIKTGRIGPGRLILVVGPSGAGKDTLLRFAQATLQDNPSITFSKRIVTREPSPWEDNEYLSEATFNETNANGDFAFCWEAHGLQYALSNSLLNDIGAGCTVVANVSRTIIAQVRETYENVTVVLVTAPAAILAARLAERSRTSDGNIGDRLDRVVQNIQPDIVINNVAAVERHGLELVQIIRET